MTTFDPDVELYFKALDEMDLPPSRVVTVEAARERYRRICRHFAEHGLDGVAVEEVEGPVRARLYGAEGPVLLWFHGGRMISGDLETHDSACRLLAAATGWRVCAVDYRLAPEHPFPAALDDAATAMDWCRARFGTVAVGGDSAGACLALYAALRKPGQALALILMYPMVDATMGSASHEEFKTGPGTSSEDIAMGYDLWLPEGVDREDARVSPLFAANLGSLPPTWVLTAEIDPLRDEGQLLAARAAEAGARVKHECVEHHIHGFLTAPSRFRAAHGAARSIGLFLNRVMEV